MFQRLSKYHLFLIAPSIIFRAPSGKFWNGQQSTLFKFLSTYCARHWGSYSCNLNFITLTAICRRRMRFFLLYYHDCLSLCTLSSAKINKSSCNSAPPMRLTLWTGKSLFFSMARLSDRLCDILAVIIGAKTSASAEVSSV